MPKRPDDVTRQCWLGACDDCIDQKCGCDHHLVESNVVVYGKWTVADLRRIEALANVRMRLQDLVVD